MNKQFLRKHLLQKRRFLSPLRRQIAEKHFSEKIWLFLNKKNYVLSFFPMPEEINIHSINQILAKENRLILPKINGKELELFQVNSWEQLSDHSKLNLKEPNPDRCRSFNPELVDIALIPALGFDSNFFRLGYGKGHYDRLLPKLKNSYKVGVGFQEQFLENYLPKEPHDQPVDKIFLT